MKSSPKAPAQPDPKVTAAAQTQTNKDTAYWNAVLNNVNQYTPYGQIEYKQTGGGKTYNDAGYQAALSDYNAKSKQYNDWAASNPSGKGAPKNPYTMPTAVKREDYLIGDAPPSFSATTKLSPEQQALYDAQVSQDQQLMDLGGKQIGRIQESANTPFSYAGIADAPTNETVMEQQLRAEEALMSRLNPQFGRDEEAMRTRLINQGITQGSEAYNREMDTFNQMKNDARSQAVLGGQQYGTTAQNNALQRRNQGIQEYTTQRNAPLNEYIGFTSGTQIQNPQFQNINYQGTQPVDYAGMVQNKYNSDYQNYSNKVASRNQNMSTLGSLAGMAVSGGMGGGLFGGATGAGIGSFFGGTGYGTGRDVYNTVNAGRGTIF